MHHGSGGNRSLPTASLAFGQVTLGQIIVVGMAANGANESIRPAQFEQVVSASSLRSETSLELRQ